MTAVTHAIPTETDWHALRAKNVGSSEVAALFNVSPYKTRFELWHEKAGNIPPSAPDHERIKWGERLEPAIAGGVAEDLGWLIRKVRRYLTHPTVAGMGASLDYEILNHPDGAGCLEVKNVDRLIWFHQWIDTDESRESPLHIELQLQHQLAVTGRKWGAIAALVGGNDPVVIIRTRHDATITKIEAEVAAFWQSIKEGKEPSVGPDDWDAVKALYPDAAPTDPPLDLTADKELPDLCATHRNAGALEGEAKKRKEAAAAAILHKLGKADKAKARGWFIGAPTVKRGAYAVEATSYRTLKLKEQTL